MEETITISKKEYDDLLNYKQAYHQVFKGVSNNANRMVNQSRYSSMIKIPVKYRAKIVEDTLSEVRKLMRKELN